MAARKSRRKKGEGGGRRAWLSSLLGLGLLMVLGFFAGLGVGVAWQEPQLVFGHLSGAREELAWTAAEPRDTTQAVAVAEGGAGNAVPPLGTAAEEIPARAPEKERGSALPAVSSRGPEPSAKATGSGEEHFAVQVGAFGAGAAAERLAEDLRSRGFPVYVVPAADSKDGRWRVRVGPVEGRGRADAMARRLKSDEQLPTWVLRSEGR